MSRFSSVSNVFFHLCDELEHRRSEYVPQTTNSWLSQLDEITNTLQPGMLTAIAAHPGMGVLLWLSLLPKIQQWKEKSCLYQFDRRTNGAYSPLYPPLSLQNYKAEIWIRAHLCN